MPLRKQRTTEDVRRRKGIDSFIRSLGTDVAEYGKGRLRDYPQEVASGWKNILGITKRVVPENLEGVAPIAESVGGMSISINQALKQLGWSAVKLRKLDYDATPVTSRLDARILRDYILPRQNVKLMAANIRKSPEEALEPLTSVKYTNRLPPGTTGRNVRIGQNLGESKIQLGPRATATDWFHELDHSSSIAKLAAGRKQWKPNTAAEHLATIMETFSKRGVKAVAKLQRSGKLSKKREFYHDDPTEMHARAMSYPLASRAATLYKGDRITMEQFDRLFTRKAKNVLAKVSKEAPYAYKSTLKNIKRSYKELRDAGYGTKSSKITRRKRSIKKGTGTKRYTEQDILKIIKRLAPKRKAD